MHGPDSTPTKSHPHYIEKQQLERLAAFQSRCLHDVFGDGKCLFRALLHSLQQQQHPLAVIHDPDSLRKALVSILDDLELHNRTWLAASDSDVAPVNQAGTLGAMLAAEAIRPPRGWSLHTWFTEMVKPHVYGDSNTLLGALLLCRLRIHVLTTQSFLGFITLKVPASFGDEYQPIYPDIWLANLADHHYFSTTVLGQNVPPQPQHAQVQQHPALPYTVLHRTHRSHRTTPHRTAPHRTAPHRNRTVPFCTTLL